jgi:hypothetical protein
MSDNYNRLRTFVESLGGYVHIEDDSINKKLMTVTLGNVRAARTYGTAVDRRADALRFILGDILDEVYSGHKPHWL